MRFLFYDTDGTLKLTDRFFGDDIPHYAILSHTWGPDAEEFTFKNIVEGTGTSKSGYQKIEFCGEQARQDGLRYFWVDTCCIDASNHVELSEAINSMYQWYANASKCYVYLQDVAPPNDHDPDTWEEEFRKSRWFTRGWTLQELLAPASVEFFTMYGRKIGTKMTLQHRICAITGIPVQALQGVALSTFSIAERISWQDHRNTKLKEDAAYSLLGICGVYMPLIYGEGKNNAFKRLWREVDAASQGTLQMFAPKRHDKDDIDSVSGSVPDNDLSTTFNFFDVYDIEHFVAREAELLNIHNHLTGKSNRRIVVLHGLGELARLSLLLRTRNATEKATHRSSG